MLIVNDMASQQAKGNGQWKHANSERSKSLLSDWDA